MGIFDKLRTEAANSPEKEDPRSRAKPTGGAGKSRGSYREKWMANAVSAEVVASRATNRRNEAFVRPIHTPHPALVAGRETEKWPKGRPIEIVEYARWNTRGGQELVDVLLAIVRNEPAISEDICDEMGRPRLDEDGQPCVRMARPSVAARLQAVQFLGKLGLLPEQSKEVNVHHTAGTTYDFSKYTHSEKRNLLALLSKGEIALPEGALGVQEQDVEGQVVDPIEETKTDA